MGLEKGQAQGGTLRPSGMVVSEDEGSVVTSQRSFASTLRWNKDPGMRTQDSDKFDAGAMATSSRSGVQEPVWDHLS